MSNTCKADLVVGILEGKEIHIESGVDYAQIEENFGKAFASIVRDLEVQIAAFKKAGQKEEAKKLQAMLKKHVDYKEMIKT